MIELIKFIVVALLSVPVIYILDYYIYNSLANLHNPYRVARWDDWLYSNILEVIIFIIGLLIGRNL